jgi:hypothetical protein
MLLVAATLPSCRQEGRGEREELASSKTIVAGEGVRGYTVGMSKDDVRVGNWKARLPKWVHYSSASEKGIVVSSMDGTIRSVMFHFDANPAEDIAKAFDGKTREGVGKDSTIANVIHIYGQPEEIAAIINDGKDIVSLDYRTLGIKFEFIDEELNRVAVAKPGALRKAYEDIGDASAYRALGKTRESARR